jgi:transglutaminase-like putative cysteine protease
VTWHHPTVVAKHFDTSHSWWKDHLDRPALAPLIVESKLTRYQYFEGAEEYEITTELDIRIRDAAAAPRVLMLASLTGDSLDEVVEFEGSFTSASGTVPLGRGRLVIQSAERSGRFLIGETSLLLTLPSDRAGRLSIRLVLRKPVVAGLEGLIAGSFQPHWAVPCRRSTIEIVVPESETLRFDQRYFEAELEEESAEGFRTFRIAFEHLAGMRRDSAMPHSYSAYPTLFWSNADDWEELGTSLSALWEPHLAPTPAIEEWLEGRIPEGATPAATALAVHDLVASGWDYLGFYPGESGWIPHPAESCLRSRLGDCKDRTALMIAMMRSLGLKAWPALVWSGDPFEYPEVPVPVANHVIVWVDLGDEGGLFLDSVDSAVGALPLRPTLTGRPTLILRPQGSGVLRTPEHQRGDARVEDLITIDLRADGGALVTIERRRYGAAANRAAGRAARLGEDLSETHLKLWLRGAVPGARIQGFSYGPDPRDPKVWVTEATVETSELVQWQGDYAVLHLPWFLDLEAYAGRSFRRVWPRELSPRHHQGRLVVRLPAEFEAARLPDGHDQDDNQWGATYTVQEGSGSIAVEFRFDVDGGQMPPDRETGFGLLWTRLEALSQRVIVLRRSSP